jgi:hypothetical protein
MNLSRRHCPHSCLLRICYRSSTSSKHHQLSSAFANVHRPNRSSLEIRQKSKDLLICFPGSSHKDLGQRVVAGAVELFRLSQLMRCIEFGSRSNVLSTGRAMILDRFYFGLRYMYTYTLICRRECPTNGKQRM